MAQTLRGVGSVPSNLSESCQVTRPLRVLPTRAPLVGRVLWHSSDGLGGTVPGAEKAQKARFGPLKCRWVSLGVTWGASRGALDMGNYIPKSHSGEVLSELEEEVRFPGASLAEVRRALFRPFTIRRRDPKRD